jgi:hypothetical protein
MPTKRTSSVLLAPARWRCSYARDREQPSADITSPTRTKRVTPSWVRRLPAAVRLPSTPSIAAYRTMTGRGSGTSQDMSCPATLTREVATARDVIADLAGTRRRPSLVGRRQPSLLRVPPSHPPTPLENPTAVADDRDDGVARHSERGLDDPRPDKEVRRPLCLRQPATESSAGLPQPVRRAKQPAPRRATGGQRHASELLCRVDRPGSCDLVTA